MIQIKNEEEDWYNRLQCYQYPSDEINIEEIGKGLSEGGTPIQAAVDGELGEGEEPEEPPIEGAKKGRDNKWYVQQDGQYYMVN